MAKTALRHIGIIHQDGRREIILHSNLLHRRDPRVKWIKVAGKSAAEVAAELQEAYDSMAGPFAAMEVDVGEVAALIGQ